MRDIDYEFIEQAVIAKITSETVFGERWARQAFAYWYRQETRDEYDEGYGDGYSEGRSEGYEDGYGDGYADGYEAGSAEDE